MRNKIIVAGMVVGLTLSGGWLASAQAITGCNDNPRCRDVQRELEHTAPDIIPWETIWQIDRDTDHLDESINLGVVEEGGAAVKRIIAGQQLPGSDHVGNPNPLPGTDRPLPVQCASSCTIRP